MNEKLYRLVLPKFRDPVDADKARHDASQSLVAVAEVPSLDGMTTATTYIVKDFYDLKCKEACYFGEWDDDFALITGDPKDSRKECIDDFYKHYTEIRTAGFDEVTPKAKEPDQ